MLNKEDLISDDLKSRFFCKRFVENILGTVKFDEYLKAQLPYRAEKIDEQANVKPVIEHPFTVDMIQTYKRGRFKRAYNQARSSAINAGVSSLGAICVGAGIYFSLTTPLPHASIAFSFWGGIIGISICMINGLYAYDKIDDDHHNTIKENLHILKKSMQEANYREALFNKDFDWSWINTDGNLHDDMRDLVKGFLDDTKIDSDFLKTLCRQKLMTHLFSDWTGWAESGDPIDFYFLYRQNIDDWLAFCQFRNALITCYYAGLIDQACQIFANDRRLRTGKNLITDKDSVKADLYLSMRNDFREDVNKLYSTVVVLATNRLAKIIAKTGDDDLISSMPLDYREKYAPNFNKDEED